MADQDCIFCRIVAGEIQGRIVGETEDALAFEDAQPQAPTHVLIVPKRHVATLNDVGPGDGPLLGGMVLLARRIAQERDLGSAGYRLVVNTNRGAGQSVFHLHLHLLGGRPFSWPPG